FLRTWEAMGTGRRTRGSGKRSVPSTVKVVAAPICRPRSDRLAICGAAEAEAANISQAIQTMPRVRDMCRDQFSRSLLMEALTVGSFVLAGLSSLYPERRTQTTAW